MDTVIWLGMTDMERIKFVSRLSAKEMREDIRMYEKEKTFIVNGEYIGYKYPVIISGLRYGIQMSAKIQAIEDYDKWEIKLTPLNEGNNKTQLTGDEILYWGNSGFCHYLRMYLYERNKKILKPINCTTEGMIIETIDKSNDHEFNKIWKACKFILDNFMVV